VNLQLPFSRRLSRAARLWVLLALCCLAHVTGFAGSDVEFRVKAGFLYNFAKFTEWPAGKLGSPDAPIVIGMNASNEFIDVLEKTVAGKTVGNRRIVVRKISSAEEARACHLLMIGYAQRDSAGPMLAKARDANVLTVGESDNFNSRGGIINFYMDGDNVRFQISARAAERAGLKLSARLLSLAKVAD
jgi:hypothetical protein